MKFNDSMDTNYLEGEEENKYSTLLGDETNSCGC